MSKNKPGRHSRVKKIMLTIFFLQLVLFSHTQTEYPDTVFFNIFFEEEGNVYSYRYKGKPQHISANKYRLILLDMKGIKIASAEYRKKLDNKDGPFIIYDSSGNTRMKCNFRDNYIEGIVQVWHENGQPADSGAAKRNIKTGTWKSWYYNGKMFELKNYIPRIEGNHQYLHGAPVIRGNFFRPSGLITEGFLTGAYLSWYPDGRLKDSGYYHKGYRNGIWIEWLEEGALRFTGLYKKGKRQGDWKLYDLNGRLLYVIRYKKNGAEEIMRIKR
jgi:antitoxin component YwqK of YwqJK toxin-antitoxin module